MDQPIEHQTVTSANYNQPNQQSKITGIVIIFYFKYVKVPLCIRMSDNAPINKVTTGNMSNIVDTNEVNKSKILAPAGKIKLYTGVRTFVQSIMYSTVGIY